MQAALLQTKHAAVRLEAFLRSETDPLPRRRGGSWYGSIRGGGRNCCRKCLGSKSGSLVLGRCFLQSGGRHSQAGAATMAKEEQDPEVRCHISEMLFPESIAKGSSVRSP